MCGVLGIMGHKHVAQDIYDGLMTLQHRGQDASGIITYDGKFRIRKSLGLVKDVFHTRHMKRLTGHVGLGHTRYSTAGSGDVEDAQPFLEHSAYGIMLAHNGNLFNSTELKQQIFDVDHRLVNSDCDAEVLLQIFSKALARQIPDGIKPESIWNAVKTVYDRSKGAYSVVAYIAQNGMLAFRDPHGIRPLIFGERTTKEGTDYIFASESVTLDILGFKSLGDVKPGEAVFISEKTRKVYRKSILPKKHIPCIFEYIYFARPDSILNGISVYSANMNMGEALAKQVEEAKLDIDVVVPVPDSSRTAAMVLADRLGLKYQEGLVKNRYIGRTFIMPGQTIRQKSIRYKLNPMKNIIEGKKVLLVDDSIVRGNTSKQIVEMVRQAGAKKVYFAVFSPPVVSPCLYGIDIPTKEELIGYSHSIEKICSFIKADKLFYLDVKSMYESILKLNPSLGDFCMACFDGKYKTNDITEKTLNKNACARLFEKSCGGVDK